jgi:hypothetical protein
VDANVLHLHGAEIELSGAPGILVATSSAAMVERRDEQVVFALLIDDGDGDAGDQIERVLPACRLHLPVAPHHRVCQPPELGIARAGVAHFSGARATHRAEAGVHNAVLVGLDDDVHVFAVLLDDVVHGRRVPSGSFGALLLAEVDTKFVLAGRGATLLVSRPRVGLVAAADDAIVADDVELLGVLGDDRKPVDMTLVSHCCLPQSTLDSLPYRSSSTPSA